MPLYDFHTHSFFSDGALLPMELIRRAHVKGYTAMAITDHASASNIEELVEKVTRDCDLAWERVGLSGAAGRGTDPLPAAFHRASGRAGEAGGGEDRGHSWGNPGGTGAAGDEPGERGMPGCGRAGPSRPADRGRSGAGRAEQCLSGNHQSAGGIAWATATRSFWAGRQGRSFWSTRTRIRRATCTRRSSPARSRWVRD